MACVQEATLKKKGIAIHVALQCSTCFAFIFKDSMNDCCGGWLDKSDSPLTVRRRAAGEMVISVPLCRDLDTLSKCLFTNSCMVKKEINWRLPTTTVLIKLADHSSHTASQRWAIHFLNVPWYSVVLNINLTSFIEKKVIHCNVLISCYFVALIFVVLITK